MPRLGRFAAVAVIAAFGCGSSGCTVVKPLVGAISGPVVAIGASNGDLCGCGDWRGVVCALAICSAIGAAGGLVTGIVSDVRVLTGDAVDPTDNWWDPFEINH
jgi:hypothetical protein